MRAIHTVLVLLLLLAACAPQRGPRRPAAPDGPDTVVRVENRSFTQMNIYVLRGSQRIRLGSVPGVSTRSFELPRNLVFGTTSLRFLADPLGSSRTPISREIPVREGDELVLTIGG
jgi:hypothetical protein